MNGMRKVICLIATLILCLGMVAPAFAAENEFVPSIEYKDPIEIIDTDFDGEDVSPCLIISTIKQATEKTTDITQHDRDLLLSVYDLLLSGEMKLPLESKYVIRDLLDVSFRYQDCRQKPDHGNKPEILAKEGITITITFKMGIGANETIKVFIFEEGEAAARTGNQKVQGQWVPAKNVKNNGDGTLTVEFEDICPVAFVVEKDESTSPTGDIAGGYLMFLVIAMVVCAAGIVVLVSMKVRRQH